MIAECIIIYFIFWIIKIIIYFGLKDRPKVLHNESKVIVLSISLEMMSPPNIITMGRHCCKHKIVLPNARLAVCKK